MGSGTSGYYQFIQFIVPQGIFVSNSMLYMDRTIDSVDPTLPHSLLSLWLDCGHFGGCLSSVHPTVQYIVSSWNYGNRGREIHLTKLSGLHLILH